MYKRWQYFESLDGRKYINWKDAPERELVRLDEISPILYTNETAQFICEASQYLFTRELVFKIEFQNETLRTLETNNATVNITMANDESNLRLVRPINIIGILSINLPLQATGIYCVASFWNSTEQLEVSRIFETRHLRSPEITGNEKGQLTRQTFYKDETNQRLSCFGKGEPKLKYSWYYNDTKVSEIFPTLRMSLGSYGESYLEFPKIDETNADEYAGEYSCVAENRLGKVEKRFVVEISDKPKDTSVNAVYISVGVVGSIMLVILVIALLVFVKRYNLAQKMLRNLTDAELEEFFEGRPELLGKSPNAETVEFTPYNMDYEIPLSYLQFAFSEASLLGSGEFAYVVRGLIISKNKTVALKVSKSSADINLFKSLLSEVKIMSYIGEHENVMHLVGVCTENIQNRSIYIATEICELGGLNSYLIKSRPSFVDLINENQEIDASLHPQPSNKEENLTTMDLVNFSAQIARGMEYLAYKSVIHADLATRNVLITANKTAKVSDFGLSKKLYGDANYVKKSKTPLPWRWMAIESLQTLTFSTMTDVWSYGVTLYEIFTLGDVPFPNEHWSAEFVTRLEGGLRMGRPKYSTHEIYSKIVTCWENEPELRPQFETLRKYFEGIQNRYSHLSANYVTQARVTTSLDTKISEGPTSDSPNQRTILCIANEDELYENV